MQLGGLTGKYEKRRDRRYIEEEMIGDSERNK
jgi:hypothetical protein